MGTSSSRDVKIELQWCMFWESGPVRVGGLCRNESGEVQWAFSGSIGVCDATEAEVKAAFYGIKKFSGGCLDNVIVEGDSLNVMRWLKGGVAPPWRFLAFFDEIEELISGSSTVINHVRRTANEKADLLARRGVGSDSLQWFDHLPP
ncbi:uncharacterized protein LOC143863427 [Tasmannia lanceolata]|uniref:uncharacterized protein LOC143863427 n=1 Tax=Tasmannia lanceolata TaxID=3420 RepID=UPI004064A8EE